MKKNYLYLANWKMYLSHDEAVEFAAKHCDELVALSENDDTQIVICPSFVALYPIIKLFEGTKVRIGAQDSSDHNKGPFTGQTSAQSLHQVGCHFGIVGHSERRSFAHETDEEVAKKVIHLIDFDVSPVICIGETEQQNKDGKTQEVLETQLKPVLTALCTLPHIAENFSICIAYEPIWSIGTGKVATPEHLETIFSWLKKHIRDASETLSIQLLYGGSVNESNISDLKSIPSVDGFLIGSASTRFQELKKIVE